MLIPNRPEHCSKNLLSQEMDCLNLFVLYDYPKELVFVMAHPEYLGASKGCIISKVGKQLASEFFASAPVIEYINSYRETVKSAILGKRTVKAAVSEDDLKSRKVKALRSIFNYVIDNSLNINNLSDPSVLLKLADKIGFFEDLENKVEEPRRYLAERCNTCRYKKLIDKEVELGNIIEIED